MSIEDELLHSHGYSDWSTINIDQLPVAVTFPKSTEEVSIIAKICHKRRVPMSKYTSQNDRYENETGRPNKDDESPSLEVRALKAISQHHLAV